MIDLGPLTAANVSRGRKGCPPGLGTPAHAPSDWKDWTSRPLCEVAGRLDPIEWPWFALVPAGVRCHACIEWMHA